MKWGERKIKKKRKGKLHKSVKGGVRRRGKGQKMKKNGKKSRGGEKKKKNR